MRLAASGNMSGDWVFIAPVATHAVDGERAAELPDAGRVVRAVVGVVLVPPLGARFAVAARVEGRRSGGLSPFQGSHHHYLT
jgi:hypothetical protein